MSRNIPTNTLESTQANNCCQSSRSTTIIRSKNHGIKPILAASKEKLWVLASMSALKRSDEIKDAILENEIMRTALEDKKKQH